MARKGRGIDPDLKPPLPLVEQRGVRRIRDDCGQSGSSGEIEAGQIKSPPAEATYRGRSKAA